MIARLPDSLYANGGKPFWTIEMRIIKKILKWTKLGLLTITILTMGYFGFFYLTRNLKSDEVITIDAYFMQYACGDDNDDMQVKKVNSKDYEFLIGRDIDPQITTLSLGYELKDYFWANRTPEFGLLFRLKGRLSKYHDFGCDSSMPKFWVEEIEKMDGTNKKTRDDFSLRLTPVNNCVKTVNLF
jgi:hypothetical protein